MKMKGMVHGGFYPPPRRIQTFQWIQAKFGHVTATYFCFETLRVLLLTLKASISFPNNKSNISEKSYDQGHRLTWPEGVLEIIW